MSTIVVNLFGVPGAGKSTGAAYIFSCLKMAGVNAELVTEFAKDKVYEESAAIFRNQAKIFGEQYFRLTRVEDKVDVIVTDSPLALCVFYNKSEILGEDFNKVVLNCFNNYDNMNYLVFRNKPYNPNGRFQNEEESNALEKPMIDLLKKRKIPLTMINGDMTDYNEVVTDVLNRLGENKND